MSRTLLELRQVSFSYALRQGLSGASLLGKEPRYLPAVRELNLEVRRGECLALVGESGSGKSTMARLMLRLLTPQEGSIVFAGQDLGSLSSSALRSLRRRFQLVFQDASAALDPRMTVGASVEEPLRSFRMCASGERQDRVRELFLRVGLAPALAQRLPHQLSGGQRQRVTIARALASEPELLVLDEPVSALDVSVQARILETLKELQASLGLTMVFITHDLSVVEQMADRVGVLYLGRIVELGSAEDLLRRPRHPYTNGLLASVPVADPERARSRGAPSGELPSPLNPPPGCPFHPRCPWAQADCSQSKPALAGSTLEPGPPREDNGADPGQRQTPEGNRAEWHIACHHPILTGDEPSS